MGGMGDLVSAWEMRDKLEDALSAGDLRRNFQWFALQFAVNHGVVTTPLVISTSALESRAGYAGNALLNVCTVLSSFFVAAPVVNALGLRGAVLSGMLCYCAYAGLFAAAAFAGRGAPAAQYALFCLGSACGGLAAGVLWTAQGGYFARTVDLLARKEGVARAQLTSSLAASFAALYLGGEVASKLLWSVLDLAGLPGWLIAAGFTAAGGAATVAMARALDLRSAGPPAKWTGRFRAAATLWRDPVLVLLSGLNFTFGFSAAFMNGYVNATVTAPQLGLFAVPMLAAFTALAAALLSRAFGAMAVRVGKGPVVLVGSLSFFGIPLSFFALGCCGGWRWWLLVLYLLQGAGRAMYESTSKGVFADLFPHDSVGAFANAMLQSSLSFALCFFLSSYLKGPTLAAIAMALSVLTPFGFLGAVCIRQTQEQLKGERRALVPA